MSDTRISALTEVVRRENLMMESDLKKYGEIQCDPVSPAFKELAEALEADRKHKGDSI